MADDGTPRRHGVLAPFAWAGRSVTRPLAIPEIRAQAETIRALHGVLRSRGASQGPALLLDADRRFDLEASAQALRQQAADALDGGRISMEHYAQLGGVRADELAALLQRRRVETARMARVNLGLAAGFFLAWLWGAWGNPGGFTGLLLLLSGLGLCLLFLVRAVLEAQTNWQIRTGRMGSLSEFLAARDQWTAS